MSKGIQDMLNELMNTNTNPTSVDYFHSLQGACFSTGETETLAKGLGFVAAFAALASGSICDCPRCSAKNNYLHETYLNLLNSCLTKEQVVKVKEDFDLFSKLINKLRKETKFAENLEIFNKLLYKSLFGKSCEGKNKVEVVEELNSRMLADIELLERKN